MLLGRNWLFAFITYAQRTVLRGFSTKGQQDLADWSRWPVMKEHLPRKQGPPGYGESEALASNPKRADPRKKLGPLPHRKGRCQLEDSVHVVAVSVRLIPKTGSLRDWIVDDEGDKWLPVSTMLI